MSQAISTDENCRTQSNVAHLPTFPNAFMTTFMFDQAAEAAQSLPTGWFTVALVRDANEKRRRDHVIIARVAGPPVGSFQIQRGSRGRFCVIHKSELEGAGEGDKSGPYRTIDAAVEAIRTDIGLQLEAWNVIPGPCAV